MTSWPQKCRRIAAATFGAMLVVSCSPGSSEEDGTTFEPSEDEQAGQNPIPEPEFDSDDSVRLPIAVISPDGHNQMAPIGEDGSITETPTLDEYGQRTGPLPHQIEVARTETFGCEDTISVIHTVPTVTDNPAEAALDYLLSVESVTHGSPAFSNPLAISEDLSVESVELDDNHVTVTLDAEPVARDGCETWRVAKQIETTARIATGADSAEVRLGETTLAEHWGLVSDEPLQITQIERD